MNFYKKRRIKEYFKKYIGVIVGTGAFLLFGLVVMLVGFYMAGWSIVDWLQSKWATTFFIMLIFGLIGALVLYILWKKSKLL